MGKASVFADRQAKSIATKRAFVKQWTAIGAPVPRASSSLALPAFVDALASAAEGKAPATYRASRPFAEDTDLTSGLYYLGESQASMEYGAFVRALPWTSAPPRPAFRSIAAELDAYDADMTSRYETMRRDDHPTYIVASAALKQARALDASGHYTGALFEYLLSKYVFSPLRGPASASASVERIAAARQALGADRDHSIAEFFLQLAEEGVGGGSPAQLRNAAAVLDDVLPAYQSAIAAASTTAAAAAARVTITLVRWPFT
jgi:hypothetical protein